MSIIKILRSRKGNVVLETAMSFLVFALVTSIALSTFIAVSQKYTLIQVSNNVKRIIETDGKYDNDEKTKIAEFLNSQHLENVTVTVSPQEQRFSLNEQFTVTLTRNATLAGGTEQGINIPISATAHGSCEVFNK